MRKSLSEEYDKAVNYASKTAGPGTLQNFVIVNLSIRCIKSMKWAWAVMSLPVEFCAWANI